MAVCKPEGRSLCSGGLVKNHCPVFVEVVDVSGAAVIAEVLPACRVDLLENCGHSVVMERPCRTAKLILDFIITQQNARGGTKKSS